MTSGGVAVDRKERLKIPPQPIPKQPPAQRVHNWEEVCLGFDLASARLEANRCIQCPAAPCVKACPLHNDIPGALLKVEHGDPLAGADIFRLTSPMPEVCGRLCPQERLCEGSCVVGKKSRPVAIGRLEAFAADFGQGHETSTAKAPVLSGRRVAVVGAGPAGLAAAERLAVRGHAVTVLDAWPQPGGLLRYGIPGFKLAKARVDDLVNRLVSRGVGFLPGIRVGTDVTVDSLFEQGFDAVFLAFGAEHGNRLEIPGEDLDGVYGASEFLVRLNVFPDDPPVFLRQPLQVGAQVVVIGGGDTAMDCVRSAVRAGAEEVLCVYRRSEREMGGRAEERQHAREEGVKFLFQAAPVEVLASPSGRVRAVRIQRMEMLAADESGRARPVPVPGSEIEIAADTVVVAIGYRVEASLVAATPGVERTPRGTVVAGQDGATGRPGVFAAGDCVRGADLVVTAVADALRAADAIDRYLANT
ncbi:MAG: NAD(P)-dependent oxidoreductase [Candidatus Dormibacterales bacterium]